MRVLLLGGDVRSNLGDRAIRTALIQCVHDALPDATCYSLSRTPDKDAEEFGVTVLGRHFADLLLSFRQMRHMDVVLWGGGQLLQDDSSLVKNVYWAIVLTWVHRVHRLPVLGLGVGIGPLQSPFGIAWARRALKNLGTLIGRDPATCAWASQQLTGRVTVREAPDLAVFLEPATPAQAVAYLRDIEGVTCAKDECLFGVAVRRWYHLKRGQVLPYQWIRQWGCAPQSEPPRFEQFLDHLGGALGRFGKGRKVRLLFFPMASLEWEGDAALCARVAARAGLPAHILKLQCNTGMVKAVAGLCDWFTSVRMHSALFAMSMGVPACGFVHTEKTAHCYQAFGQGDACMTLDDASATGGEQAIHALFERIHDQREERANRLRERMRAFRAERSRYVDAVRDAVAGVKE